MKWPLLSVTVKARFTSFTVLEIVAAGARNSDPETLATEGTWAEAAKLKQINKERTNKEEKRTNPSLECTLLPRNAASTTASFVDRAPMMRRVKLRLLKNCRRNISCPGDCSFSLPPVPVRLSPIFYTAGLGNASFAGVL